MTIFNEADLPICKQTVLHGTNNDFPGGVFRGMQRADENHIYLLEWPSDFKAKQRCPGSAIIKAYG